MKKKLFVLFVMVMVLVPLVSFAQLTTGGSTVANCELSATGGTLFGLICRIAQLINAVVPVLIALGVLYFVWGVVGYVIASDEEAKSAGRNRMIFGIIGLAVVIGLWGLVNLLRNTFGLNNTQNVTLPTVPTSTGPGGSGGTY